MVAQIPITVEDTPETSHGLAEPTIRLADLVRFVFASKALIIGGALLGILLAGTLTYLTTP